MAEQISLEEFLIKEPVIFPVGRSFDYGKILALPDEKFAQFYLALMDEYRTKDGWWNGNKIPKCFQCSEVIPDPSKLRRYYGLSLDPNCFKALHQKERRGGGIMNKYWDRVAQLELTN